MSGAGLRLLQPLQPLQLTDDGTGGIGSLRQALAPVFAMLVPVLLVAFALLLLMRERPLKTENE